MADPVEFPGQTGSLGAPPGQEAEVRPLPVYRDGVNCISCWQLTPEELAEVARTGCVWLLVNAGVSQPPVYVSGEALVAPRQDG